MTNKTKQNKNQWAWLGAPPFDFPRFSLLVGSMFLSIMVLVLVPVMMILTGGEGWHIPTAYSSLLFRITGGVMLLGIAWLMVLCKDKTR